MLCSLNFSFGLEHMDDLGADVAPVQVLNSVITINENETFLA